MQIKQREFLGGLTVALSGGVVAQNWTEQNKLSLAKAFSADFYLCVTGNDSFSGTSAVVIANDGPFSSVALARDAVRELVGDTFDNDSVETRYKVLASVNDLGHRAHPRD